MLPTLLVTDSAGNSVVSLKSSVWRLPAAAAKPAASLLKTVMVAADEISAPPMNIISPVRTAIFLKGFTPCDMATPHSCRSKFIANVGVVYGKVILGKLLLFGRHNPLK